MRRTLRGLALLLLCALALADDRTASWRRVHEQRRQQRNAKSLYIHYVDTGHDRFFIEAAERMETYKSSHGRYPGEWQMLDIHYACGGYDYEDVAKRRLYPKADQGPGWRPRGCGYTFVIRRASAKSFLIEAVSDTGIVEYEMHQGMERPRDASPLGPLFSHCAPGSDGYDQGDERAARLGKDPSLSLNASFTVTEDELVLSYQVENRGPRDAYLFTGVEWNALEHHTDAIYVHHERDTKTVWLNKKIPTIPVAGTPRWPALPGQTSLRAGATFREEIHVPLPVEEFRAYADLPLRPRRPPVVVPYEGVRFTLQYYWRTEGMTDVTKMVEPWHSRTKAMTDETALDERFPVLVTRGGAPIEDRDFGFLESDRVPLRIPVLQIP